MATQDHREVPLLTNSAVLRAHERQNQVHTLALLAGLGALIAIPVLLIWGLPGLIVAAVLIAVMYIAARQTTPEMIMRAYKATEVTEQSGAQLLQIMTILTHRADLPARPSLHVIPSLTLNAFATGSRHKAAVAVTEGLLRKLTIRELTAVLAHEIGHVKNNDLSVMAIADIGSRLVQGLSYVAVLFVVANLLSLMIDGETKISWLAIIILYLAPLLSSLLQLGLSRSREYDADLEAAQLTGKPAWLASALARLERDTGAAWEDLMLPVPGRRVAQPSVFRSHPTTASRIARLQQLEIPHQLPPILIRDEPFVSVVDAGVISMRPRHRFPGIWF